MIARDGRPIYHRQLSEPSIPFPPQGFKQEYPDPLFEHPAMMGTPVSSSYPASIMIKQEPRDFTYDPGEGGQLLGAATVIKELLGSQYLRKARRQEEVEEGVFIEFAADSWFSRSPFPVEE